MAGGIASKLSPYASFTSNDHFSGRHRHRCEDMGRGSEHLGSIIEWSAIETGAEIETGLLV